jgi:hypothetical protein
MDANDALVLFLVIASRGLAPMLLWRWPFWGGLGCILADAVDTMIQDALGSDVFRDHYHQFDKAFDTYYLGAEAFVAWRKFDPLARVAVAVLFGLRLTAAVLFEITGARGLFLYLGPNVVENLYLWVAAERTANPQYCVPGVRGLLLILLIVGPPKILQEYVMHYLNSQTWHFVKENILLWR